MSPAFYMQKQNFLCWQKQNAYTESALMFLLMIWYDVSVKRSFDTHLIPGLLRSYATPAILQIFEIH